MEQEGFSLLLNGKLDYIFDDLDDCTQCIPSVPCIVKSQYEDDNCVDSSLPNKQASEIEYLSDQNLFAYNRILTDNLNSAKTEPFYNFFEVKHIEMSQDFPFNIQINQNQHRYSVGSSTTCDLPIAVEQENTSTLDCFKSYNLFPHPSPHQKTLQAVEKIKEKSSSAKENLKSKVKDLPLIRKKTHENPINKVIEHIQTKKIDPYQQKEELIKIIMPQINVTAKQKPQYHFLSQKAIKDESITKFNCCTCKKSHCLKMYCECFKYGKLCYNCTCPECLNRENFQDLRQQSIQFIKKKCTYAFKNILERDTSNVKHSKGCKCINSSCLKNYCECFQFNVKCSIKCKCKGCKNQNSEKED